MAEAAEQKEEGKWYRVCLNTIVRKDMELDSERLRILPMGSRVHVVEKSAENPRRVKISSPIEGWCSMSSSNGDTILAQIDQKDDAAVGGVASTPKSISSKLDHFRKQNDERKKMIANPKLNLSNKNVEDIQNRIAYDGERLNEVETRIEEHGDMKYKVKKKYGMNETVRYRLVGENVAGHVGVIRWSGKNEGLEKIKDDVVYLVEVAYNAGDCDGTITWKTGEKQRVVELESSKSGAVIGETQIAGTINSLSLLEKLEELITEVGALRKLKQDVETHNKMINDEKSPYSKEQKVDLTIELPKLYAK